jgi:hypothetical protein
MPNDEIMFKDGKIITYLYYYIVIFHFKTINIL